MYYVLSICLIMDDLFSHLGRDWVFKTLYNVVDVAHADAAHADAQ